MTLLPLISTWFVLWFTADAAPSLAHVGETIGTATVVDLVDHPEFHRILVDLEDGRTLTIEVVVTEEPLGACTHHGFALQPRWELLGVHDLEVEDQPAFVGTLCDRLEAAPPQLGLVPPHGTSTPEGVPDADRVGDPSAPARFVTHGAGSDESPFFPLQLVILGLFATLGVGLWRRYRHGTGRLSKTEWGTVAGVALLGLLVRTGLGLWAPLWAPLFGFGRLASVLAEQVAMPRYGGGYVATMNLFARVFGGSTEVVFVGNLLLGALAPPIAWALARSLWPREPAAAGATGLLTALLPVHVWLSTTEVMHLPLVTYELLAVWAAVLFVTDPDEDRTTGALLALASACATVLAVHTRPEGILFVVVPAAFVLLHARKRHAAGLVLAAVTIAAGVALRLAEMAFDVSDEASALNYGQLTELGTWLLPFVPDLGAAPNHRFTSVLMRPALTSPLLPALAVVGAWARRDKVVLWIGLWWAATLIPVLPKGEPLADAYRLQLPAMMAVLVLAGSGAAGVLRGLRERAPALARHPALLGLGLAAAVSPQLFLERPTWGTLDEARFMIKVVPTVERGATVLYDSSTQHAEGIARWGAVVVPDSRWIGMQGAWHEQPLTEPLMAWIGTSCTEQYDVPSDAPDPSPACEAIRQGCTLRPFVEQSVPLTADTRFQFHGEVGTIGLYFLDECTPPDNDGSPEDQPSPNAIDAGSGPSDATPPEPADQDRPSPSP